VLVAFLFYATTCWQSPTFYKIFGIACFSFCVKIELAVQVEKSPK